MIEGTQLEDNLEQSLVSNNQSGSTSNNPSAQSSPDENEVSAPNGYKFLRTIGDGSFGKVKLGVHLLTEEKVAIKILCKQRIRERTDIQRISRQIKIMKVVNHPFIVQMYEIIQSPKYLFLIMEFVEGGDLFDVISNESKLSEQMSRNYFSQMILGLQYLHKLGISHRDMKPQNILIAENHRIKIADFGLGNFYKQGQKLKTACGSPCYAPPEMLNQEQYSPQKVDIWSSGVILYAMIHGYLPFQDDVTSLLYQKIKTKNVRVASWVGIPCRNLLRGVLTKDQNQRLNTQSIKKHQFLLEQIKKQEDFLQAEIGQIDKEEFQQVCEQLGIVQQERLLSNLKKFKHNNLTTLYYLGRKKILREIKNNIVQMQDHLEISKDLSEVQTPRMPQSIDPIPIQLQKNLYSFSDKKQEVTEKYQKIQEISLEYSHIKESTVVQEQQKKALDNSNSNERDNSSVESPNVIAISPIEQSNYISVESSSAKEQIRQFITEKQQENTQSPKHKKSDQKIVKMKNTNQGKMNQSKVGFRQTVKEKDKAKVMNDLTKRSQKDKKQDKYSKAPIKGLKKSERMPTLKPKEQTSKTQAEIKLYERSQSKDRPIILKNTLKLQKDKNKTKNNQDSGVTLVVGKAIHIEPHLIDADKLVLCSGDRICQILSKKGFLGKLQYFSYSKECILVVKAQLKSSKNGNKLVPNSEIQKIIGDINQNS